ncbi:hypothetical protein JOQ06_005420 [Pogonophryne albipinna]|uniref:Reverse transcriptase domain-containing protein n=1 Tax=Pogonophryne albipinna TaxID=1090488 RepID=A0AAD6FR45_9TELE|nr:hypothetical protein JOQ06_005420 [Pogonophryne albipinna]
MELVKELVKKAIPSLSSDKMDALMARLVELGVQCEDDLILVEAPDIQDTMPLIQCRRLVKAFQGDSQAAPQFRSPGPTSTPLPQSDDLPPTPPETPPAHTPSAHSPSCEPYSIPWHKMPSKLMDVLGEKKWILERMIHSRIEPVVDSQLPREQAGFRRGRSTADQVTLLCQDIEDSFQDSEKAGAVYLDLTAAYDTVWLRGLHLKLLRTIPDRHMVKFIMETLSNRSFILQTSSGQCSRLRRLKNGVPQGSVLSPMLFNVYIHDLPDTASRKYGYADDLTIMLSRPTWKAMEEGLNEDMGTLVAYLRRWRLQLSVGKTVAAAYHLSTREARRELEVRVDNKCLEVQQAPMYLGVRLDRTLSFKKHLEEVKAKVTSRVALIRRLAGTTWGASAKTLRISTQALVFSVAEYCAPLWSRSPHARKESSVRKLMAETYPIQRETINDGTNVKVLKEEWPFLFEAAHLFDHASRLLGFSVQNKLAQELSKKELGINNFLDTKGMKMGEGPVQLICGIVRYFKENPDHLFCKNELLQ